MKTQTPWGMSDQQTVTAPGIVFHSTPSHGGFHLSPDRQREVQKRFPGFRTFAGGPWYEEDCDWAVVILTFPETFNNNHKIERALDMVRFCCQSSVSRNRWLCVAAAIERMPRECNAVS